HYWERGNTSKYVAPDVSVIAGPPPSPRPGVYLSWSDPPVLFAAEVSSPSNTEKKVAEKRAIYERDLQVPECLHADPPKGLRFWRLVEGSYHPVAPGTDGRVWSAQLGVWFGYDETGFLRMLTADG